METKNWNAKERETFNEEGAKTEPRAKIDPNADLKALKIKESFSTPNYYGKNKKY